MIFLVVSLTSSCFLFPRGLNVGIVMERGPSLAVISSSSSESDMGMGHTVYSSQAEWESTDSYKSPTPHRLQNVQVL